MKSKSKQEDMNLDSESQETQDNITETEPKDEFTQEELDSMSPIKEYIDGLSDREKEYALDLCNDALGIEHEDRINDHDEDNKDEEDDTMGEFAKYKENYK